MPSPTDRLLTAIDGSLRTLFSPPRASRPNPALQTNPGTNLTESERRLSGALMRVNHVGEVCAQALYTAQALGTPDAELRRHLDAAAREETDHLAWTRERLDELGDRASLLNPLWYAGSYALGALAGLRGDGWSLGFVVETERQVEAHLDEHLETLPPADLRSREILTVMKADEARHADHAQQAGARTLPAPIPTLMAGASQLMKAVAYRL